MSGLKKTPPQKWRSWRAACYVLLVVVGMPCVLFLLAPSSRAHEMRPGYLEIRETEAETYAVLWKVPARGLTERFGLYLRWADDVEFIKEPVGGFTGNAYIERMQIRRAGGLAGALITIEGLERTLTDVLLRLDRADGSQLTHRFTPDAPGYVIESNR